MEKSQPKAATDSWAFENSASCQSRNRLHDCCGLAFLLQQLERTLVRKIETNPILPGRGTFRCLMADYRGKTNMFHTKGVEMVSNGVIGRRLLNVREAAQYLGLEVDTVYKKSRLREIPCVKVGRALRFDVKALERYIEQHTIETID